MVNLSNHGTEGGERPPNALIFGVSPVRIETIRRRSYVAPAVGLCVLALALFLTIRPARAFETCPANVGTWLPVQASATLFAFDVEAPTARTVRGDIAVQTDRGWFRIPFGPVSLQSFNKHYRESNGSIWTWSTFASPVMRVQFPEAVKIENYWVEIASSTGDSAGWSSKPAFRCDPGTPGYLSADTRPPIFLEQGVYEHFTYTSRAVIPAEAVAPIVDNNCANPNKEATPLQTAPTDVPLSVRQAGLPLVADIQVLIARDGTVADASVAKSSKSAIFDLAALSAVRASTFQPKRLYCQPVYGEYIFRESFAP